MAEITKRQAAEIIREMKTQTLKQVADFPQIDAETLGSALMMVQILEMAAKALEETDNG